MKRQCIHHKCTVHAKARLCHTCRMWKGTGDEGSDVADRIVMTSGLSSAFSLSDINILFTVMLHMTSMTPAQQTGKRSVNEVSPRNQKNNIQLSFSLCIWPDSDSGQGPKHLTKPKKDKKLEHEDSIHI